MTPSLKPLLLALAIVALLLAAGCTVKDHDSYTQATIKEKFFKAEPMAIVPPNMRSDPAWYRYDYFITYTDGATNRVDHVSKDVYNSVFEGNTYTLKWGYVDDMAGITKEYGFVEVIS